MCIAVLTIKITPNYVSVSLVLSAAITGPPIFLFLIVNNPKCNAGNSWNCTYKVRGNIRRWQSFIWWCTTQLAISYDCAYCIYYVVEVSIHTMLRYSIFLSTNLWNNAYVLSSYFKYSIFCLLVSYKYKMSATTLLTTKFTVFFVLQCH